MGAAVDILCCCYVSAYSSLFCFCLGDVDEVFLPSLAFLFLHLVVGYAKPCWRDGHARISNAAACQCGRSD